jgi:hypothetical protein
MFDLAGMLILHFELRLVIGKIQLNYDFFQKLIPTHCVMLVMYLKLFVVPELSCAI